MSRASGKGKGSGSLDKLWGWMLKLWPHLGKVLLVPLLLNFATFAGNILVALGDDGIIDEAEFHQLLQGASGTQIVILVVVMALLRVKR